jgi:hypothetical protein
MKPFKHWRLTPEKSAVLSPHVEPSVLINVMTSNKVKGTVRDYFNSNRSRVICEKTNV